MYSIYFSVLFVTFVTISVMGFCDNKEKKDIVEANAEDDLLPYQVILVIATAT